MERSGMVAAAVSVVVVFGITIAGVGWHARSVAAQAATAQTAAEATAAKQAQDRADAVEAAKQAQKLQALVGAQKRIEAKMQARYTAQAREAERPKFERVQIAAMPQQSIEDADQSQSASGDGIPMFPEDQTVTYTDSGGNRHVMSGHQANNYEPVGCRGEIMSDQDANHAPLQFEVTTTASSPNIDRGDF